MCLSLKELTYKKINFKIKFENYLNLVLRVNDLFLDIKKKIKKKIFST